MIQRFKPNDPTESIVAAVEADGVAILDELVPAAVMDRLEHEVAPWLERVPFGAGEAAGVRTRRLGGLVARSATARALITHPSVLEIVRRVVG